MINAVNVRTELIVCGFAVILQFFLAKLNFWAVIISHDLRKIPTDYWEHFIWNFVVPRIQTWLREFLWNILHRQSHIILIQSVMMMKLKIRWASFCFFLLLFRNENRTNSMSKFHMPVFLKLKSKQQKCHFEFKLHTYCNAWWHEK